MADSKQTHQRRRQRKGGRATTTARTSRASESQSGSRSRTLVALLRGINVTGKKVVPMAELREVAEAIGCHAVATYIQSGNLVVESPRSPRELETALEQAIALRFGFPVEVIVRSAAQWQKYAASSPFARAEADRPARLLLGLSKRSLAPGAAAALRAQAKGGECIEARADALYIDYCSGVGVSKLTPVVLDRAAGSTVTARNWRTVQKLAEMCRAR